MGGSAMSAVRKLEHLFVAGGYLQVRREANRLLLEGKLSVHEQGIVLRLAGRACLQLGEYYAAAKLSERATERAHEVQDVELLCKARFDLGYAYLYIGDPYGAEENLHAALSLLKKMAGLRHWEPMIHYNLSAVHQQRRQWHTAVEALERAARLFEEFGQRAERTQCDLDLAWCYLMLGVSSLAAPHLAKIEEHLSHHLDDMLSADLICQRALYYRLEGDIARSSHLCQEIFVPGRKGVTAKQLGEATWIMGENSLDLGRFDEANLFVNMALDHATRDNYPILMNLACDLRRRIASRAAIGA